MFERAIRQTYTDSDLLDDGQHHTLTGISNVFAKFPTSIFIEEGKKQLLISYG